MRFDGVIRSWDDERGFGFIEPLKGGDDLYAHITAFPRGMGRPQRGQRVSFQVELGRDGRKHAREVHILRPGGTAAARGESRAAAAPVSTTRLLAIPLFMVLGLSVALHWPVAPSVLIAYVVLSLGTFALYALDQSAARRRRRRLPEDLLLGLGLAGGWPGALVAQVLLRHKSAKPRFQILFWISVLANVAAFVTLAIGYAQLMAQVLGA